MMLRRVPVIIAMALCVAACGDRAAAPIEGRPGGPYRMSLTLEPAHPRPGETAVLSLALTYRSTGKPVTDLQIAHERLVHTFITDLEFSSFAHIHHEDFAPLRADDRAAATVSFPYRFARAGHYRIVSEFVHRDRTWAQHFDVAIGDPAPPRPPRAEPVRTRTVGDYTASLQVMPASPIAGAETAFELHLQRGTEPVTDLSLYLGTELHGAVWREDGAYFGHMHSFTPKVAAIMALAHDRDIAPAARGERIAAMMTQLMCLEAELVFNGPTVPLRYVFPEAGRSHLFLQVAPGGVPHVFQFAVDVSAAGSGAERPPS
jgi:hypothetical protein